MFVGLNPSFSEDAFSILRNTKYSHLRPRDFYLWSNRHNFDRSIDEQLDRLFRERYAYFSKFKEISNELHLPWEYADLFFYRCTKQKDFKTIIQDSRAQLNDFALEQLSISKRLIAGLEPRIIIIANALASHIYLDQFRPRYVNDLGYHLTTINDKSVPTFPGSMFTGQRAMDIYSFQRLRWLVRKTVLALTEENANCA